MSEQIWGRMQCQQLHERKISLPLLRGEPTLRWPCTHKEGGCSGTYANNEPDLTHVSCVVQDLHRMRLQGTDDGQAAFNGGLKGTIDNDLKLWMVTAARYALVGFFC